MKLTLETLPLYCTDCGDCMLWALGRNSKGWPQARLDGKPQLVQRYIVTQLQGRDVPPRSAVTTKCGERLCVAPAHLVVRTRSAILRHTYATERRMTAAEYARRLARMQADGRAKLDWDTVEQIRARPAQDSHAKLAREFGMSEKAIANVRTFRAWRTQMAASSVFSWRPASGSAVARQQEQR